MIDTVLWAATNADSYNDAEHSVFSSYIWELPSQDGDMASDLLLELGAQSAQVVLGTNENYKTEEGTTPPATIDWDTLDPERREVFDKTGKMQTESSAIIFSTLDDATAQRLVQGVSDIMDWNATKAWTDCQLQNDKNSNTSYHEVLTKSEDMADEIQKDCEIHIGNETLVISNSARKPWAFGDGNHPSTRVMLTFGLENYVYPGSSVLDYGCGSGILALSAKAIGASRVTAVDISDEALEVTRFNMKLNFENDDGDDAAIQILHSDKYISSRDFDIVLANIPSNTCLTLLRTLEQSIRTTTPSGVLLLSGYPANEADLVRKVAREEHGLDVIREFYDSGWVLQVLKHLE